MDEMTLDGFRTMLRDNADLARDGFANVVADRVGGSMSVGKHEAKNWVHLRGVLAEADETCPRAADTIRWLLWHGVLDAQRLVALAGDIPTPSGCGPIGETE